MQGHYKSRTDSTIGKWPGSDQRALKRVELPVSLWQRRFHHPNPSSHVGTNLDLGRVMLNLPPIGWRVHQVLITPAFLISVMSGCGSALVFVAGYAGWLNDLISGGGESAGPTMAPTVLVRNSTEL